MPDGIKRSKATRLHWEGGAEKSMNLDDHKHRGEKQL